LLRPPFAGVVNRVPGVSHWITACPVLGGLRAGFARFYPRRGGRHWHCSN